MNTFKKKSLNAALAGLTAIGAVGVAQAVNVNADGLGQALIYPYYTTRADSQGNVYNTLISVVNSTQTTKAVKVRFIEGKNSKEVLDFNLFLSPYDVWTANVIPLTSTGGAGIVTDDVSCTIPPIPSAATTAAPDRKQKDFVNYAYTGPNDDGADQSLDRTKEGYVEIIEMATYLTSSTTYKETIHDQSTGRAKCTPSVLTDTLAFNERQPITGGLFGSLTLINVFSGSDFGADATALDNFASGSLYSQSGEVTPNMQSADPQSLVISNNDIFVSDWSGIAYNAADAVSAVLMHDSVMNEFVVDPAIAGRTDWVVTFPTKNHYIDIGTGPAAFGLFQKNFDGNNGSCDDVSLSIYDREERTSLAPVNFSPRPPSGRNSLCWEANVVTFNNTNVFSSKNVANVPTSYLAGWLKMGFHPTALAPIHTLGNDATYVLHLPTGSRSPTSGVGNYTYWGLPLVGFAAIGYSNGNVTSASGAAVLSTYGANYKHKVTSLIQ